MRRALLGNFSNVDVYGEEYPVSILRRILSKIIFVLQMIIIANLVGKENIRNYFSFVPREYFEYMDNNKWMVGITIFFIGNQLQNILCSSGAFEIFCNDKLVNNFLTIGMVENRIR
jgi:hypothetical protein